MKTNDKQSYIRKICGKGRQLIKAEHMRKKDEILEAIKGEVIVSCQALPDEPLHSSFIMGRMALAAFLGGAKGIRANSVEDIKEIKKTVDLPIIGIIKRVYGDNEVFITPTMREIYELMEEGVDIIALDATSRVRPDGTVIKDLFPVIREKYPNQLFMADCSTFEEAEEASEMGFDFVGTTLSGYTSYTRERQLPDLDLIKEIKEKIKTPLIAEGGISTPEELKAVMDAEVFSAVVGSAITRPMEITKKFIDAVKK